MYDVRNGYLYLTAETEAEEEQQRAHVWIDGDGALDSARSQAIGLLAEELAERFGHLVAEDQEGPAPSEQVARAQPEPGRRPVRTEMAQSPAGDEAANVEVVAP